MSANGYPRIKLFRKKIKLLLVEAFGGYCGRCRYDKCVESLDFHHIDPEEKDFALASKIRRWNKIVDEAKKCVCLCSNCHRELHYGLWKIDDTIPRFNSKYSDESIWIKSKKEASFCPICGKDKKNTNKFCSPGCYVESKNINKWHNVRITDMLESGMTRVRIAEIFGVSESAVRKRIKKENNILRGRTGSSKLL